MVVSAGPGRLPEETLTPVLHRIPRAVFGVVDVIEHLKGPERFLNRLRAQFDYSPRTVILTTPNIAFGVQRLMLLFGQFNYGKAGILDRT